MESAAARVSAHISQQTQEPKPSQGLGLPELLLGPGGSREWLGGTRRTDKGLRTEKEPNVQGDLWGSSLGTGTGCLTAKSSSLIFTFSSQSHGQGTLCEGQCLKGSVALQQSRTRNSGQNGPGIDEGEEERAALAHQRYQV